MEGSFFSQIFSSWSVSDARLTKQITFFLIVQGDFIVSQVLLGKVSASVALQRHAMAGKIIMEAMLQKEQLQLAPMYVA